MAFWGAKIKPKKPFLINEDELDGRRLHITQATLGLLPETDDNPQRSVVKCRTGESSAVFMCSLKPGLQESIPLNLYFDGPAIFFVTGPAAVHLCGYLEDMSEDLEDDEDMSDDSMDEDFVVDDDEEVEDEDEDDEDVMRAPVIKAHNVRIEEITDDGEKGNERLAIEAAKPEEKKQNEETSEDEDGFPTKRKNSSDDTPNKKSKTSDAQATPATPAENQSGKKKKRKAKKQEEEGDQPAEEPKQTEKSPASKGKSKSDKKRFANGLEIENVKMGKPDGKQAKIGKKASTK